MAFRRQSRLGGFSGNALDLQPSWLRLRPLTGTLVLLACAAGTTGYSVWAEARLPTPRDISPSLVVDGGPYTTKPNCPLRRWEPGEFLPRACILNNVLDSDEVPRAGLEPAPGRDDSLINHAWVRAGDDVLLVEAPLEGPGRIRSIVWGRFAASPAQPLAATEPDARDYSRPSFAYLWFLAVGHGLSAMVALLSIPFVWLTRERPRKEPEWLNRAAANLSELQQAPPKT